MRKLLFLFTMLAFFIACSDDDDKDNELPIKGLEIPKFANQSRLKVRVLLMLVKFGLDKSFLKQQGTVMLKLSLLMSIQLVLLLQLRKFMVINPCF